MKVIEQKVTQVHTRISMTWVALASGDTLRQWWELRRYSTCFLCLLRILTMETLAQAMTLRQKISMKQIKNKYSGMPPISNDEQQPTLNFLVKFKLVLRPTIIAILLFRNRYTGQLSEQEGTIYLMALCLSFPTWNCWG